MEAAHVSFVPYSVSLWLKETGIDEAGVEEAQIEEAGIDDAEPKKQESEKQESEKQRIIEAPAFRAAVLSTKRQRIKRTLYQ